MDFEGDEDFISDPLSEDTIKMLQGKSFLHTLASIRSNPQEILPALIEALNNETFRTRLQNNKIINSKTFLEVDLDLINSIY